MISVERSRFTSRCGKQIFRFRPNGASGAGFHVLALYDRTRTLAILLDQIQVSRAVSETPRQAEDARTAVRI